MSKLPNYVTNSRWDCIENERARLITIIEAYRSMFSRESIPQKTQYWTMCGAYYNMKQNRVIKGELDQLLEAGLIQPDQFNGVDREKIIIEKNKEIFPHINWYYGDFYEVLEYQILKKKFNPAIIFYDGVMQPKFGMQYLKKILKMIDYNVENELLLTANVVLTNPYNGNDKCKFTVMDAVRELASIYWIPDHWDVFPRAHTYTGDSRNGKAKICTLMFLKEKHKLGHITFTSNRPGWRKS